MIGDALLPALTGAVGDGSLTIDGVTLTWDELADRAIGLGHAMVGMPAVAIEATPTLETVVAVCAALASGVAAVPVPPDAGPVEREHILRDSGAQPLPAPSSDRTPLAEPPRDTTALIIYTSGTTGAPKGVLMPRRAIAAGLDGLAAAWGWTSDDRLVHGLPLFHVHGLVLGVLGALRVGCELVHTGRPTPTAYAAAKGSLYFGVPTVWGRVVADPDAARSLGGARLLVSGSAPLPVQVFEQLRGLTGHEPVERYGMTETLITLSTRVDGERRPGWVGRPINGVETRLVDEDGEPVARDGASIGELEVRGATMFDGYLHRPDATEASFRDGWFRTGDAAVVDSDGFHRIVGRQSMDIIKTGGFKVGAGEVESALLDHPAVQEVAVVGLPDDDLGQRIVAYVVLVIAADEPAVAERLIEHVATTLSVHKRPREIRVVAALPRNAMGKVQKNLLR